MKADYKKERKKAQKKDLKAVIREIECNMINKGQVVTPLTLAEKYMNKLSITYYSDNEYQTSLLRQNKIERFSISNHIEFYLNHSNQPLCTANLIIHHQ